MRSGARPSSAPEALAAAVEPTTDADQTTDTPPIATVTVQRREGRVLRGVEPVVVFVRLEVGQAGVPAPVGVARQLCPLVVVARLAAHVDHAVDAGAAAQRLAARIAQAPPVEAGVGLGLVEPVGARVADAIEVAHRNVDPVVVVLAARFHQQHALGGIGREAVGHEAAGGATADHDVVEGGVAHGASGSLSVWVPVWPPVWVSSRLKSPR